MKVQTFLRTSSLVKRRLSKIKELVDVFTEDLDSIKVQQLLDYSDEAKLKISDFDKSLKRLVETETNPDFDEDQISEVQDEIQALYISIDTRIKVILPANALQTPVAEPNLANFIHQPEQQAHVAIKLPKIELKHFDGDPMSWVTYINLFDTTIHGNPDLPCVAKFQYLLGTLSGEPLSLIKSLPLTAPNYQVAYDILKNRYDSPRRLITLHLNKILDLPNLNGSTVNSLRQFLNQFNEHTQALKALNYDVCENNHLLLAVILRKLDNNLRKRFESRRDLNQDMPKVSDVINFLNAECSHSEDASLHALATTSFQSKGSAPKIHSTYAQRTSALLTSEPTENARPTKAIQFPCFCCSKLDHKIYTCPLFKDKTPQERHKFVSLNRRCVSCLGKHDLRQCKSKSNCFKCSKPHHTLLHFEASKPIQQPASTESDNSKPQIGNFAGVSTNKKEELSTTVLLATVLVKVTSPVGVTHVFRALLDSCSQCDFMTEKAAQILNVKRFKSLHSIDGISQSQAHTNGSTHATIGTLSGETISTNNEFHILDKITSYQPRARISSIVLQKVAPYVLADPSFHLSGPVDLLLGGNIFPRILTGKSYSLGNNLPHVIGTCFGFVVMGQSPCYYSQDFIRSTTLLSVSDFDLHSSLQKFWTIEEPPSFSKPSKEEILCNAHFSSTHFRDSTGRYHVRLPFKPNHEPLGNSRTQAEKRFLALEKKFRGEPKLEKLYVDFMSEYENLGHMVECDSSLDLSKPHFYLPHHGVLKENSSTNKLRTVFDGSCKTSTQVSLNDTLMCGPKLQINICDILLKYRCHNIVFSCDIRHMYRNISLQVEDQPFQLILWRKGPSETLKTYKLTTVTYGINCSPYLAIKTLHQLAQDEGNSFPKASKILCNQTYVDDVVAGASTIEEAICLQEELVKLLKRGSFELRKWTSNSPKLLGSLPQEHCETPHFIHPEHDPHFSILGIQWCATSDSFSYKFDFSQETSRPTKRKCLSWLSQIYDPCGFLAPITMWAKGFMQLLWTKGLDWDDPLPPQLAENWAKFVSDLNQVVAIKIPRCLGISNSCNISLCGFSDACESGYAAVVYLHCEAPKGITVRQIISKTRVAPLRVISLPRLELCGSHLLSQLIDYCLKTLASHCKINHIRAYTDSSIVQTWIKTPPYRLKTFVANRVAQIQEAVSPQFWYHVKGSENPADCASRGLLTSQLIEHPLWWTGPCWLSSSISDWPVHDFSPVNLENSEELKQSTSTTLVSYRPIEEWDLLRKFSKWTKLQYVMAYILRFVHNSSHANKKTGFLSTKELQDASLKIYSLVQKKSFFSEFNALKENKQSMKLKNLSPFLDSDNVIRVGGRLKNATIPYDAKHCVVLPKTHHVTNLLIDYYHVKNLHSGPQLTQALLSQSVWILSARSAIRSRIYKCIKCFKCKPKNLTPLMGNLPSSRINPSRCFLKTGVDLGGPFNVKSLQLRNLRHYKAYICLFVCFSTKAVHLEIVSELSTESFLAALTRFVSRRGLCTDVYSDCGTNFVGANNQLRKLLKIFWKSKENQDTINNFCIQNSINFHFNPPAAPHQGGLWESGIKSMKHHLQRIIGETILTYEEFHTVTTRVEAVLNSRPLTPMSSDPADLSVLTPAHFIIGSSLSALPEPEHQDSSPDHLRRWQRIQVFSQHLWRRWSREYLYTLQQRMKWNSKTDNLQIGDLVLIHDSRTSSLSWPLGRVLDVSPGSDNIVRVVKVQTQHGVMIRPVVKVFPLPINNNC